MPHDPHDPRSRPAASPADESPTPPAGSGTAPRPDAAGPAETPSRPGRLLPGAGPKLRRAGRTAAVLGLVAFVLLVTVLSSKYPHGARPEEPTGEPSRPVTSSPPLSAERIEDLARRQLRRSRRAARPAPPPPDLAGPSAVDRPPGSSPTAPASRAASASERSGTEARTRPALHAPLAPRATAAPAPHAETPEPSRRPVPRPELPDFPPLSALGTGPSPAGARPAGAEAASVRTPLSLGARHASSGSAPPTPGLTPYSDRRVPLPESDRVVLARRPAPARPVLYAGTAVPLTLTHAVATDVPGPLRATVARDVLASTGRRGVVLPRGTLVLGHQAARSAAGDRRVLIEWTTLKLPDGTSFRLPPQPAGAADGTAGARGRVDNHWWSRMGSAIGLSLVGAGAQLAQPQQRSAVQGFAPSAGQLAAQQLGLELSRLSQEILRRGVHRPPTIELEPGQRLTLLLTRDLLFPALTSRPASSPVR